MSAALHSGRVDGGGRGRDKAMVCCRADGHVHGDEHGLWPCMNAGMAPARVGMRRQFGGLGQARQFWGVCSPE